MINNMKKEELENLIVYDITFQTTDKKGKVKYWTTSHKVDHSFICERLDINDFEEVEEILERILT